VYRGASLITPPPPLGPPQGPRHEATVRSYGGVVSYERGTTVRSNCVVILVGRVSSSFFFMTLGLVMSDTQVYEP
jgi:hypothetical protein